MANIYNDLITYFASELGGSWAVGTNLFYPRFPTTSSLGIAIRSTGGLNANNNVDQYYPFITVTSREEDIDTALSNWQLIFDIIKRTENYSLANYHVMMSLAINSDPMLILDGPNEWEWEGAFSFRYRPL